MKLWSCASPWLLAAALHFTCSQKVMRRDTRLGAHAPSSVCSCASFQALNKRHIPPRLPSSSPDCELPGSRFLRRLCCGAILLCATFLHLLPLLRPPVSLSFQGLVSICTCKCRHLLRLVEELHKLPAQPSSDGYKSVLSPNSHDWVFDRETYL